MVRFVLIASIIVCAFGAIVPRGLVPMLDGRIVGGTQTTIEEFPHQISIRYFGYHHCGGSIISERIIVSAAHCVEGAYEEYITIVAGATSRLKGGKCYYVKKIISHERYNGDTLDYDISILILKKSLKFGKAVQPIKLPNQGEAAKEGSVALVSGWGAPREGSNGTENLQFVKINVINQSKCAKSYGKIKDKITKRMICAGAKNGGRDSCQGDSGGPLISAGKLIGVVSWGHGCARPKYPGVYARVSNLRNWIDENSSF